MSLKKYILCDKSHESQFEYVCLKQKRVFCSRCWQRQSHYVNCQSSRCGNYSKLAHLTLSRALQYKNAKILQVMCHSFRSYDTARNSFLQLNFKLTEQIKQFVEQKLKLLYHSMINQILLSKHGNEPIKGLNKFDSLCTDMLKIIKSGDKTKHNEYLESAIGAYFDINHALDGQNAYNKQAGLPKRQKRQDNVNEVLDKLKQKFYEMISSMKINIRKTMDAEIQKSLGTINNQNFKGITFYKITKQNQCFRKRQQYPYLDILSQELAKIQDEQKDLYRGFEINLSELQKNPQQLLRFSKCLIKQRLFNAYEEITSVKSQFPYKLAYPICTTLTNDPAYEQLIFDLQKSVIETSSKQNPFVSSLSLYVMGKDLVVIKFYNQPKFSYTRCIYNYKRQRQPYYAKIIQKFGLRQINKKKSQNEEYITFREDLTDAELVYCHFKTVCSLIFENSGDDLIFQGERVMADRGAEIMMELVKKWREMSKIDINFDRTDSQLTKMLI